MDLLTDIGAFLECCVSDLVHWVKNLPIWVDRSVLGNDVQWKLFRQGDVVVVATVISIRWRHREGFEFARSSGDPNREWTREESRDAIAAFSRACDWVDRF